MFKVNRISRVTHRFGSYTDTDYYSRPAVECDRVDASDEKGTEVSFYSPPNALAGSFQAEPHHRKRYCLP